MIIKIMFLNFVLISKQIIMNDNEKSSSMSGINSFFFFLVHNTNGILKCAVYFSAEYRNGKIIRKFTITPTRTNRWIGNNKIIV